MTGIILIGLLLQENILMVKHQTEQDLGETPSYGIVDLNASYNLPVEFNGITASSSFKC